VNTWGNTFLVPVTHRGKERIRILASQDGTTITQTGGTIQTGLGAASLSLNAGQFVELETTLTGGGCYISANKPVAVCAYMVGSEYGDLSYKNGDPAMAWVPPIEQTVNGATIAPFVPSASTQLTEHYALIVTATDTRDQTTVAIGTGAPAALSGSWTAGNGAGSGYSFYSMQLTSTTSSYYFYNPNGLVVMGYGLGQHESYYYLSGASARNLDAAFYINDTHYQDIDGEVFCGQQSFAIRAVIQYAMSSTAGYLKWYVNGTEETSARDVLQWNKTLAPGTYLIEMKVLDMYNQTHTESTAIVVRTQAVAATVTTTGTNTCYNTTATLTGASTGVTSPVYRWYASQTATTPLHEGATFVTPALTATTTYYVSVEGSNYCENAINTRRAVSVTVISQPAAPTLVSAPTVCSGNPGVATVTPPAGCTTDWYTAATGGTPILTGNNTLTTSSPLTAGTTTSSVTYYAESRHPTGGCRSASRTEVIIQVSPCTVPVNPHLRSGTIGN
jgi:hypothetical protein